MSGGETSPRAVDLHLSAEEAEAAHARAVEAAKVEKREEYHFNRAEYDSRVAALPGPFRDRIEGFRARGGDEWRYQLESYELFVCEQAVLIASKLGTVDAIRAFLLLSWKEQVQAVPGLSEDHSGNTLGAACRLAAHHIQATDLVPMEHGALCPLVGCEESACYSTTAAAGGAAGR